MSEEEITPKNNWITNLKEVFTILKDPNNKEALKTIKILLRVFVPNPFWKLISDVIISGLLILTVLYCANHQYIEKANVQSFLTLIIGAIIGSRFKNN